jgi:hypothetical protein
MSIDVKNRSIQKPVTLIENALIVINSVYKNALKIVFFNSNKLIEK